MIISECVTMSFWNSPQTYYAIRVTPEKFLEGAVAVGAGGLSSEKACIHKVGEVKANLPVYTRASLDSKISTLWDLAIHRSLDTWIPIDIISENQEKRYVLAKKDDLEKLNLFPNSNRTHPIEPNSDPLAQLEINFRKLTLQEKTCDEKIESLGRLIKSKFLSEVRIDDDTLSISDKAWTMENLSIDPSIVYQSVYKMGSWAIHGIPVVSNVHYSSCRPISWTLSVKKKTKTEREGRIYFRETIVHKTIKSLADLIDLDPKLRLRSDSLSTPPQEKPITQLCPLPLEILSEISKWLPKKKQMLLTRIAKSLFLSEDVISTIKRSENSGEKLKEIFSTISTKIITVDPICLSDYLTIAHSRGNLQMALQRFKEVKRMDVAFSFRKIPTSEDLEKINKLFPIVSLDLHHKLLPILSITTTVADVAAVRFRLIGLLNTGCCPDLTFLDLSNCNLTADQWNKLKLGTKITELDLSGSNVPAEFIMRLERECPDLKTLNLRKCQLPADQWRVIQLGKNITELDLSDSHVPARFIGFLIEVCPDLKKLILTNCKNITSRQWHKIHLSLNITELKVNGTTFPNWYVDKLLNDTRRNLKVFFYTDAWNNIHQDLFNL